MNVKINNPEGKRIKILVAPLDWGLGHATRCIPIIKELVNQKCDVWVAAAGAQSMLLKEEFPLLPFVELPGYGIKYGKNRALTIFRLFFSIPKILIRIKREKAWLKAFQTAEEPDAVFSDNRYGLVAPGLFSVFITHQLRIRSPFGRFTEGWLQRINYRAIRRFSRCWIPDVEGPLSLAGELSHPSRLPAITTRYIGWLSRFEASARPPSEFPGPAGLLVLLSGPEPQRSILERRIIEQAAAWSGPITLIRGLPGGEKHVQKIAAIGPVPPANMIIHDHLPTAALATVIREADFVLSRAGYSTVMDLMKLGKKAILIPTPGQTEQEYLGAYLADQRLALCVRQSAFSLPEAMASARDFPFAAATVPTGDRLAREIRSVLDQLH
jgi:predicted glycosyltransferase